MYQDTEKLAEELWNRSLEAKEVPPGDYAPMMALAEPGWTPFEEPAAYRWFMLPSFPVKALGVTLSGLMKGAKDPGQEKFQHDRIVEILRRGEPEWPVFVTATGVIVDGYHRAAAHRTLGMKTVPVVIAVHRPSSDVRHWDERWNEAFPLEA